MTKIYNSTETDTSDKQNGDETGRKGGSAASARPGDESPVRINDYTGTTSEKSPARYFIPLIIAFIVVGCFLALRSRFNSNVSNPTGGTMNSTAGTTNDQNKASSR
jgi:hypothetical protein